jgi:predicted amidophosphoribosyltransferase
VGVRLLEALAELFAPTRCAGCDLPGSLVCDRCAAELARLDPDESCPRCGAPFGALVCTECWSTSYAFEETTALGELARPLSRAVVLHKDAGERRLGPELGARLGVSVARRWRGWPDTVTWVPPTAKALARRGFDHAAALAEPVALALGVPATPLLARRAARDQRSLDRAARARNAASTFVALGEIEGRVLIVDDVFTTGATLDAAAAELLDAGAEAVRAAVVARAW